MRLYRLDEDSWERINFEPRFSPTAFKLYSPHGEGGFIIDQGWIYWYNEENESWYRTHPDWKT